MKKIHLLIFAFFILSCSTQNVAIDFDRSQDFSQLTDYQIEFAENQLSELDLNRLQLAIQQELGEKGMQYNENSAVRIKIKPEEYTSKSNDSYVGVNVGSGGYRFGSNISVGIPIQSKKLNQNYKVSIYNAKNQLVWDSRLDIQMPANASPETMENNIQKGVQKLFKNYPPKKK